MPHGRTQERRAEEEPTRTIEDVILELLEYVGVYPKQKSQH